MNMYGDDWQYADSRLNNTIVRYEGKGVFVNKVMKKGALITSLRGGDGNVVNLDDLDLTPVKLGFANIGNAISYLTRMPMRRDWRQGLRVGNFTSVYGTPADLVNYNALADTIEGIYPTLQECVDSPARVLRAWCREWAVGNSKLKNNRPLIYKNLIVGCVRDGNPELSGEFMFLREALQEVL